MSKYITAEQSFGDGCGTAAKDSETANYVCNACKFEFQIKVKTDDYGFIKLSNPHFCPVCGKHNKLVN